MQFIWKNCTSTDLTLCIITTTKNKVFEFLLNCVELREWRVIIVHAFPIALFLQFHFTVLCKNFRPVFNKCVTYGYLSITYLLIDNWKIGEKTNRLGCHLAVERIWMFLWQNAERALHHLLNSWNNYPAKENWIIYRIKFLRYVSM